MNLKKVSINIFRIFLPLVVGTIIGLLVNSTSGYDVLDKPLLSLPAIAFPLVWSIIYLLMGISYYLFKKNTKDKEPLTTFIYYLQLFVNALWSIIFFVWEARFFAIIWILLLLGLVIFLFILFIRKVKISAYLLILYIIWLLFATYLTIGIYILNR